MGSAARGRRAPPGPAQRLSLGPELGAAPGAAIILEEWLKIEAGRKGADGTAAAAAIPI